MGCIVFFKVSGKNYKYETNLSEDEIDLQHITEEITNNKIKYFEDDSEKATSGTLPEVLSNYLVSKRDIKNIKQKFLNYLRGIKKEDQEEYLVGNYSLDELNGKFSSVDFNELRLEDDENILFVRNFEYEGIGFGGSIKIGNKKFFIIRDARDAQNLEKYLKTRKNLQNKSKVENKLKTAPDNVKEALNYIAGKNGKQSSALLKFFNHPSDYLYKITEKGVDVHTTLSNYIQRKFQNEYIRQYDNQFINTIINSSDKSGYEYYISEKKLNKILTEFGFLEEKNKKDELNEKELEKAQAILVKKFREFGYPIKLRKAKSGAFAIEFAYRTFNDVESDLVTMEPTELAVQQTYSKFGFKIYKYANKFFVSKNTIITRNSQANQFDSKEEAIKYIENRIKKGTIYSSVDKSKIGIKVYPGAFNYYSLEHLSLNTAFSAITNYSIPYGTKIESEELNNLLHSNITDFLKYFNKHYNIDLSESIDSYEKAYIFLQELSNSQIINKESIKDAINTINNLEFKRFLVLSNKFGNNNYLIQEIKEDPENWQPKDNFAIPVIGALENLANQINKTYIAQKNVDPEFELVKIITESDFENLPKEINRNARGFIYQGVIYINASRASLSDLSHEMGHLILGMIKASNIEVYMKLIEQFQTIQEVKDNINRKRSQPEYQYLAQEDLIEEIFVDQFGKFIVRNDKDLGIFGNEVNSTIEKALEDFGNSIIGFNTTRDFFNNFNNNMKTFLFNGNGLEVGNTMKYRQATNFISKGIEEKTIEMNCKP